MCCNVSVSVHLFKNNNQVWNGPEECPAVAMVIITETAHSSLSTTVHSVHLLTLWEWFFLHGQGVAELLSNDIPLKLIWDGCQNLFSWKKLNVYCSRISQWTPVAMTSNVAM